MLIKSAAEFTTIFIASFLQIKLVKFCCLNLWDNFT